MRSSVFLRPALAVQFALIVLNIAGGITMPGCTTSTPAAFMVAGGVSPLWIGFLADRTGDYRLPLLICSAALLVPIALFLRLPALRRLHAPPA